MYRKYSYMTSGNLNFFYSPLCVFRVEYRNIIFFGTDRKIEKEQQEVKYLLKPRQIYIRSITDKSSSGHFYQAALNCRQ